MSLYSRPADLLPMPTTESYEVAHSETDKLFGSGGSWLDVVTQFKSVDRDFRLRSQFLTVAQYGYLLNNEELSSEGHAKDAPEFLLGRAFTQGFVQQLQTEQRLFSAKHSLDSGIDVLNRHYSNQDFENIENGEMKDTLIGQYVNALGEYGLHTAGEPSLDYIKKWSTDAYPLDSRLSRAFQIGHGVMILCASIHQAEVNEDLIKTAREQVDLDEEVRLILSPRASDDR